MKEFFAVLWLKTKFIAGGLYDFFKPAIDLFLSEAGKALKEVAPIAVKAIQASLFDADGEEKRKAAFDMIVNTLEKRGIQASKSAINLSIELAYQKYIAPDKE